MVLEIHKIFYNHEKSFFYLQDNFYSALISRYLIGIKIIYFEAYVLFGIKI